MRMPEQLVRVFVVLLMLAANASHADGLFDDAAILDVELIGPLKELIDDKKDRKQLPFVLRAGGIDHEIKVRVRGKSRIRVCTFVQMRLNFSSDVPEQSIFFGQGKLKLATHCRAHKSDTPNLLEEYLAYRIFNIISDVSFSVRLLRVNYVDNVNRRRDAPFTQYAFVIEDDAALAERVDAIPVELPGIVLSRFDEKQAALMYLFQYMIGNTDWSLVTAFDEEACCHNGKLIERGSKVLYVPYDFDLSGLVNARYAKPDPSLNIRNVRTRRYRGFCMERATVESALDHIVARQTEIMGLVDELEALQDKDAAEPRRYLGEFFKQAENRQKFMKAVDRHCLPAD